MTVFSQRPDDGSSPDTTIARAVLAPAVLTMAADGHIDETEIAQLTNLCMFSPIYEPVGPKVAGDLIKDILQDLGQRGAEPVIKEAAEALSPALCETAFCFAMRVAMADGVLDEGERDALSGTAALMQLDQDAFAKIVEVIAMMQRPATA